MSSHIGASYDECRFGAAEETALRARHPLDRLGARRTVYAQRIYHGESQTSIPGQELMHMIRLS